MAFLPLDLSFPNFVNPATRVRRNVLMSHIGHLPMYRHTPNTTTFYIMAVLEEWDRLTHWFKSELVMAMSDVRGKIQAVEDIRQTMESSEQLSQPIVQVSSVMLQQEVQSFTSGMVPLNAFESTSFLTEGVEKAQTNGDLAELQNLLLWQLRTRLLLQPILEQNIRSLENSNAPILPRLRSLERLVHTFPVGMGQVAHMVDSMGGSSRDNSWQTEQAQWLKITNEIQQILFLSDHIHAPVYTRVLCELRRRRLLRDNPHLTQQQLEQLLPEIILNHEQPFGDILKEGIMDQTSVPRALESTSAPLDSDNAALRADWLSILQMGGTIDSLPRELAHRVLHHPLFEVLSKQGTFRQGVDEFDFITLALNKAQLILESVMLAPPMPREMATPGYGASTPLFAQPAIDYNTAECSLVSLEESVLIIEIEKISCDISMADDSVFQGHLVAMINPPDNAIDNKDFPPAPSCSNQDECPESYFSGLAEKYTLTKLLFQQPMESTDFIQTWWQINQLCSKYRCLPIVIFRLERDFLVFQNKMEFFQDRPEGINMVCVVPPLPRQKAFKIGHCSSETRCG